MSDLRTLIENARQLRRDVDAHYDREPPAEGAEPEWEAEADRLAHAEGQARAALILALSLAYGLAPFAVLLDDGSFLTVVDDPDGLAIIPADRIIRFPKPETLKGATRGIDRCI